MQNGSFPYDHFFDLLSGKWKSCIMIAIDYEKHIHFNAFQKLLGNFEQSFIHSAHGTGKTTG